MKDSIEKVINDLGAVRIENVVGTEAPATGLYPEDFYPEASHFLCLEQNMESQIQGGAYHAKKKRNIRH
jgi:hypothetical protein